MEVRAETQPDSVRPPAAPRTPNNRPDTPPVPGLHPQARTEATLRAVASAEEWLSHLPPHLVGGTSIRGAAGLWPARQKGVTR